MRSYSVLALGAAAMLAAYSSARAEQDVKPATSTSGNAHRLEISNGPTRTVHVIDVNASPAERQRLRDLTRAENDVALTNRLQGLRMEYLDHERRMERQRFETNYRQAGTTHAYAPGIYPDMVPVVDARILYEAEFNRGAYGYGGFGWGFPGLAYGFAPQVTGVGSTVSSTFVEPGPLMTEIVKGLSARATPEYADQANRNYLAALSQASQSDSIAKALNQPTGGVPVSAELPREIVLKNGEKVEGTLVQRDADWVVLDDAGRIEVRTSEIARIRTGKK